MAATPRRHIGRLIETARKIRGLTADEVGRRCNVTRSRVYQWEKQAFILPKNLPWLARALGMPLKMLLIENGHRRVKKSVRCLKLNKMKPPARLAPPQNQRHVNF